MIIQSSPVMLGKTGRDYTEFSVMLCKTWT